MIIAAKQRSDLLRAEYLLDMSIYKDHPELFVFVDGSGANRRDTVRKLRTAKPATVSKLMVRGQRVSTVLGISCNGILDFHTSLTTIDAKFKHYVEDALVPYLQPFNGVYAHSIVLLDNASIHHVEDVVDTIQCTGALTQFLPPYSPNMNPIEHAFAQLKLVLKAS